MSNIANENKNLTRNVIIFAIGNLGSKFISFLLVPLYTGILSPTEYGVTDLIYTLLFLTSPLVMLNMWEGILRFSLDEDADHDKIRSVSAIAFLLGMALSLLLVPLTGYVPYLAPLKPYRWKIALYVFVYSGQLLAVSHLRGQKKLTQYAICSMLTTLLIAVFSILFLVRRREGVDGFLKANTLAYAVTGIIGFFLGRQYRVLYRFKPDWALFRKMTVFSLTILPGMLAWWITNSSDRIMVANFEGEAANGLYAAAAKLPTLVSTLGTVFLSAWPYSAVKEKDDRSGEYSNYIYSRLSIVLCLVSGSLLLLLKPIMRVYVADSFYESWRYSPALILSSMLSGLGSFLATAYYVHKDNRSNCASSLVGAGVNILLNFLLIPRMGVQGAVLATFVSYTVVFFYLAIDTRKYLVIRHKDGKRLITVALTLTMALLVYLDFAVSEIALAAVFAAMLVLNRGMIREFVMAALKLIRRNKE